LILSRLVFHREIFELTYAAVAAFFIFYFYGRESSLPNIFDDKQCLLIGRIIVLT